MLVCRPKMEATIWVSFKTWYIFLDCIFLAIEPKGYSLRVILWFTSSLMVRGGVPSCASCLSFLLNNNFPIGGTMSLTSVRVQLTRYLHRSIGGSGSSLNFLTRDGLSLSLWAFLVSRLVGLGGVMSSFRIYQGIDKVFRVSRLYFPAPNFLSVPCGR